MLGSYAESLWKDYWLDDRLTETLQKLRFDSDFRHRLEPLEDLAKQTAGKFSLQKLQAKFHEFLSLLEEKKEFELESFL